MTQFYITIVLTIVLFLSGTQFIMTDVCDIVQHYNSLDFTDRRQDCCNNELSHTEYCLNVGLYPLEVKTFYMLNCDTEKDALYSELSKMH